MDDNNSNQNENVFDQYCCIKCSDPKSEQAEVPVVTIGFDPLIQNT